MADDYYWWLKCEKGADADPTETGLDCNGWTARPWMGEEKYHPTNWCASQSIDFLRRRDPRQPFFLMRLDIPHQPAEFCTIICFSRNVVIAVFSDDFIP